MPARPWKTLRGSRLTGAVGAAAGANLLIALFGAASGILLSRLLSVAERGDFAAAQVPALIISNIGMLGLGEAMIYFARSEVSTRRTTIMAAATLSICSSAVLSVAGYLALPWLLPNASPATISLAKIWLLLPIAVAFNSVPVLAIRAVKRDGLWNIYRIVPGAAWILVILFVLAGVDSRNLKALAAGQLVSLGIFGLVAWVTIGRVEIGTPLPTMKSSIRMVRFGLPLTLSTLPQMLNVRLDQLLLVRYVNEADLGAYVTAFAWSSLASAALSAFGIVLFPRLAETGPAQRPSVLRRHLRPALAAGTCVTGLGVVLTPALLPRIFGSKYVNAVGVAQLLVVAGVLLALSGVLAAALQGVSRPRSVLTSELVGLVATVVLLRYLVPRYGIEGAAFASIAAYGVTGAARIHGLARACGVPMRQLILSPSENIEAKHGPVEMDEQAGQTT